MDSGTVSKFDLVLKINGSMNMPCQLKRHLSPVTVGLLLRMIPLSGNAHRMGKSIVYFESKINSGIERRKTDFKKGDIGFLPVEGCICFYINDVLDGKPMTIIGKITDCIDRLNQIKSSDVLSLSRN